MRFKHNYIFMLESIAFLVLKQNGIFSITRKFLWKIYLYNFFYLFNLSYIAIGKGLLKRTSKALNFSFSIFFPYFLARKNIPFKKMIRKNP